MAFDTTSECYDLGMVWFTWFGMDWVWYLLGLAWLEFVWEELVLVMVWYGSSVDWHRFGIVWNWYGLIDA